MKTVFFAVFACILAMCSIASAIEPRFSYRAVSSDTLVVSGAGLLHTVACNSDAAATAGSIILYDNTAESGTVLWSWTVSAVEYQPFSVILDAAFATGLYIGYTTTADVNCTVTFRKNS
jgi:multisubunit Na+/H+ antiporter MnhF subunit